MLFVSVSGYGSIRRRAVATRERCIAIDVGTSGLKAALVEADDGSLLKVASRAIRTHYGPSANVEQRASDWWKATCETLQEITAGELAPVTCIGVTGQMQDLILVDDTGAAADDAVMLYKDQRATVEASELTDRCGQSVSADSLLAKLLWVQRSQTECSDHRVLLGAADYIVLRLCGAHVCDPTTATTTSLTDSSGREYLVELIERAGLGSCLHRLPRLLQRPQVSGTVAVAQEMGCPALANVPVVHAGGDAAATTVGAGAGEPGSTYLYLGTSGWIGGSMPSGSRGSVESTAFALAHPSPSYEIQLGSMTTAGGCLVWFSGLFGLRVEDIETEAASVRAGSSRTVFFPHLAGERCPFVDPHVGASFVGMDGATDRAVLARVVLEGVAFNLLECMREAQGAGFSLSDDVTVVGGGSNSRLWCDILSSVLNKPLLVPNDAGLCGLKGAAAIAQVAVGQSESLVPSNWNSVSRTHEPSDSQQYEALHAAWRSLHPNFQ